ncbi:hypothetical protein C1646_774732 [Rhizophagus diaphanus]|nr:hypothetical protein C1646_774732 [Rhizophagus diaphanus] [Rhizophagus sp. MUCL 43196]
MVKSQTKISDKLSACVTKIINVNISIIKNEIYSNFTTEINSRDAGYTTEAQKILTIVSNIKEACCNKFDSVRASIEILQNDMVQCYAMTRRAEFDQQSTTNKSEATSSSPSSSFGSSNLSGILDITSDIRIRFTQHFDQLIGARNYTFDEMCYSVVVDICSLEGNIKISTVKNFYSGVGRSTVSTVNQINAWVASFNNNVK